MTVAHSTPIYVVVGGEPREALPELVAHHRAQFQALLSAPIDAQQELETWETAAALVERWQVQRSRLELHAAEATGGTGSCWNGSGAPGPGREQVGRDRCAALQTNGLTMVSPLTRRPAYRSSVSRVSQPAASANATIRGVVEGEAVQTGEVQGVRWHLDVDRTDRAECRADIGERVGDQVPLDIRKWRDIVPLSPPAG